MTGGIRPRLARLTDPDMKRFISDAVKVANDPAGKKLMVELNKQWATTLKAQKVYDKLVDAAEEVVRNLHKHTHDLDNSAFDEAQKMISTARRELVPINAAVTSFEKTEKALVAKYPTLQPVKKG